VWCRGGGQPEVGGAADRRVRGVTEREREGEGEADWAGWASWVRPR
jgi:hypothetical protein